MTAPTTPLSAWHGNADLKAEVAQRMQAHRAADSITRGFYQELDPNLALGYRGCLIGCTLPLQPGGGFYRNLGPDEPQSGWHGEVQKLYGIPIPVGKLLDQIFESVSYAQCAAFAVDSIEAMPVGVDLSHVPTRLMLDVLTDPTNGVRERTAECSEQRRAVDQVATLFERRLAGDEPSFDDWNKAKIFAQAALHDMGYDAVCAAREAAAGNFENANELAADAARGIPGRDWWSWLAYRFLHHLANAHHTGGGQ